VVEVEGKVSRDHCDTCVTLAVPSSFSLPSVSATDTSDTVDSTVELLTAVPCLPQSLTTSLSSSALDLESRSRSRTNRTSLPVTSASEEAAACPTKLLASSHSLTDLSQSSAEASTNSETVSGDQRWTDNLFSNSRNASSSSLTEMCDNRRSKATNPNRKRRHEYETPESRGLTFDKVPNYYTALSIPTRVKAGSAARSSSDLIADFLHNERDPSPERKSCSVYDKLPAYYSSFTNSTRYDDRDCASLPLFETNFSQDESENDGRYGRSCGDGCELHDLKSSDGGESSGDDNYGEEKDTDTEDVSQFYLKMYTIIIFKLYTVIITLMK